MINTLTYSLCSASRVLTRIMNKAVSRTGITCQQAMMLEAIYRLQGKNVKTISADLKMDRTTFTRSAVVLEKKGLLVSEKGLDPRSRLYAVTDSGIDVCNRATHLIRVAEIDLAQSLGSVSQDLLLFSKEWLCQWSKE